MKNDKTILAGWLVDGSGNAVRENVLIDVSKDLIQNIGKHESQNNTTENNLTDYSDYTIIPGLIDAHLHLFMSGTKDQKIRENQLHAGYEELKPVIAEHLNQLEAHGIAAVRDGGDYGGYAAQYVKEFSRHLPVQVKAAGKAWRMPGRYGRLIGRPPAQGQALASAILNEPCHDHVKIVNSGLNSLRDFGKETKPQFNLEELKAGIKAAHEKNLKVMVHCNGRLPVEIAVQAGCDSIEHGFFMGTDNLKLMADKNVTWVPTAITMKAYWDQLAPGTIESDISRRNYEHQVEQIAIARNFGVKVALGTDSGSLGVFHGKSVVQELKILIKAGYTVPEALKCATSNAAELLDIKTIGQIKPGKTAKMLAVKGCPGEVLGGLESGKFKKL